MSVLRPQDTPLANETLYRGRLFRCFTKPAGQSFCLRLLAMYEWWDTVWMDGYGMIPVTLKISFLHLSFSSLTTFYDSHDVLIDMDDY